VGRTPDGECAGNGHSERDYARQRHVSEKTRSVRSSKTNAFFYEAVRGYMFLGGVRIFLVYEPVQFHRSLNSADRKMPVELGFTAKDFFPRATARPLVVFFMGGLRTGRS